MRKEELKALAEQKGVPANLANKKYSYYLWMCLVQQWLREEHEIYIEIIHLLTEDGIDIFGFEVSDKTTDIIFMSIHNDLLFSTYNEALEDALIAGLKEVKV